MSTAFMLMCRDVSSSRGYAEARESLSLIPLSEETKKKISEFAKTRIGSKNSFYNKKHSLSQIEIWKCNHRGKPSLKKKAVIQYDLSSGEILKQFDSLQEASFQTGTSIGTVFFACSYPSKNVRKKRKFSFKYAL